MWRQRPKQASLYTRIIPSQQFFLSLELGKEIPEELYQAIVEIYLYFLKFDPSDPEKYRRERRQNAAQAQQQEENAQAEGGAANA